MPETARVQNGSLQGVPEMILAESKFLAFAAAPQGGGEIGQDADLQIQLRQDDFCAGSVIWPDWGLDFPYRVGASFNLARSNLEPWWSAWQPVLLAGAGAAMVLSLLLAWAVLAAIYAVPAKCLAWYADRSLPWRGAWRLASAALLPGALVMAWAILLYGWKVIDVVGLTFFLALHLIIGWAYVAGGVVKTKPLFAAESKRNPFTE
jgi:hypothetical protein